MLKSGKEVIKQEAKGLQVLSEKLSHSFVNTVNNFYNCNVIFVSGVGKSGHIGRKLSATFTSLGSPSVFIHPTEAAHGDMGLLGIGSGLLLLSRSGKAQELRPILDRANYLSIPTTLISESADYLGEFADETILLPKVKEAWGHAPTTSTTLQMAVGDAIAVVLAEHKGFTLDDFKLTHPGGALGSSK